LTKVPTSPSAARQRLKSTEAISSSKEPKINQKADHPRSGVKKQNQRQNGILLLGQGHFFYLRFQSSATYWAKQLTATTGATAAADGEVKFHPFNDSCSSCFFPARPPANNPDRSRNQQTEEPQHQ